MDKAKLQSLKALIVEDDPLQREGLALLLNRLGVFNILQAGDGVTALQLLKEESKPVDVLLCDIDMPKMDGMAFLRHLSAFPRKPSVILVSQLDAAMRDSVSVMAEAFGLNVLGAMPKPPSRSMLLDFLLRHAPGPCQNGPSPAAMIPRSEIVDALNNGEFVPWYQPKVEMTSGRVVGMEALARWNSRTRGLLTPGAFLESVEKHGLMDHLTWRVLAQSAATGRDWHDQGLPLLVSVNLSLSSLGRLELAERLSEVVAKQGLAPCHLILEVTETAAMSAVGPCLENLTRLRLLGFGLSIDDFGTGYSSLQQLARVPFTELKIDQSFVRQAAQHETTRSIIESSVDIARRLRLKVIAEGIETAEQWQLMATLGCDIAQGYWIAKPMPAEAVADWVATWHRASQKTFVSSRRRADILLVEDDGFQRDAYSEVLMKMTLGQVDAVPDVASALQCLGTADYGLVITDIDLGERSGLDLVRLIRCRQTAAKPSTRIVLLSSHSEQDVVLKSIALDINGYLTKPAKPHALRDVVNRALDEDFSAQVPGYYLEEIGDSPVAPLISASILLDNDRTMPKQRHPDIHCLALEALQPGMLLAEPLLAKDRSLILRSGYPLTSTIIQRLLDMREHLAAQEIRVRLAAATPSELPRG